MTQTPDGLPTLSRYAHSPDQGGACVMELVSVLAGETWSDEPMCVNGTLASAARVVNDYTDNEGRRQLLEMVELFIGTSCPRQAEHSKDLDDRLEDLWYPMLTMANRVLRDETLTYDERVLRNAAMFRTQGIPVLREMIRICDEMNGYDRSAQEPQPAMETLREITASR